jgi:hypothetical protein
MNSPFFTASIPTIDRVEMLRKSVQSVLDKTVTNFDKVLKS